MKRDIEHALSDFDFAFDSGGSIRYAVDFSEIFRHIIPQPPREDYLLFLTRSVEDALAAQLLISKRLFDLAEDRLVLLPPYAIEFDDFLHSFHERAFGSLLGESLQVLQQAQSILEEPDFLRFSAIADEFHEVGRQPSDEEMRHFVEFLEQKCPSLLGVLQPSFAQPLDRVSRLFAEDVFEDLKSFVNTTIDPDPDGAVATACYERLIAARGVKSHAQSLLDSIAISMVDKANHIVNPQNTRLLLFTRSKYMLNAVDQEVMSGTLQDYESSFLRHPRMLYIQYIMDSLHTAEMRRKLADELHVINLFIESAQDIEEMPREMVAEVEAQLEEIVSHWQSAEALEALLAEAPSAARRVIPQSMRSVIQLIDNSAELRRVVVKRLDEIAHHLENRHEYLGLYFQSMFPENRDTLKGRLEAEVYEDKCVLRTSLQAFPYSFQLYSDDAAELIGVLSSLEEFGWEDALRFFRDRFSEEPDYERLLVMAYVLGTLNKWSLAELYCERALDIASEESSLSPHEGYFFLAICQRKWRPSVPRYKRALEFLDRALEEKRGWKASQTYEDPRYLKEKGTQILMLHVELGDHIDVTVPPASVGLELLAKALQLSTDDVLLKLQIINNRLFYHIETGIRDDLEALETDFNLLLRLQQECEESESYWPAFVLDTLAWAQLILYGADTEEEREVIMRRLRLAEQSKEITRKERQSIRRHLHRFQGWINNGCPDADWLGWARST